MHEFGHSLGLSHSSDRDSLMFPWYSAVPQGDSLPKDDRRAVQHLYGSKTRLPATSPSGSAAPTRPTAPPRHAPPATSQPEKCNTDFDAVAVLRGEMWVFTGKYFWRINRDGGSREDPMELRSFWYGLPSDIGRVDAVYERGDHDIVFFAGRRFYVLAGNSRLKQGPLPLTVCPVTSLVITHHSIGGLGKEIQHA